METRIDKIKKIFSTSGLHCFVYYSIRLMRLDSYLPDGIFLKLKYRCYTGRKLNLRKPCLYTEKLQWLKLYDHNPLYTQLVDKYEVKKFIRNKLGDNYIIPTLGVWDRFDDIDFDRLPNQFVLKCTHDSGGIVICKDKSNFNIPQAKVKLEESLKRDFYKSGREWPYKNVPRRIIAEKYMEDDETHELRDYKFFCFNGKPEVVFVASERQNEKAETKFDFFDMGYNHLDIRSGHPNAVLPPSKPSCFNEMKKLAEELSVGFSHVRIDFYQVNGAVYFGEFTLYHHSGFVLFEPENWNRYFGDLIILNNLEGK